MEYIDTFEYFNEDGSIVYMDEFSYNNHLANNMKKVRDTLEQIRVNNPLNNANMVFDSDKITVDYCDYKTHTSIKGIFNRGLYKLKKRINSITDTLTLDKSSINNIKRKKNILTRGAIIGGIALCSLIPLKSNSNVCNDPVKSKIESSTDKDNLSKDKSRSIKRIKNLKVNSKINFKNTKLKYTSLGGKSVSTKKLSCDSYKICLISIISNGKVIDVLKPNKKLSMSKVKEYYKSIYGDDISIQVNVDGYEKNKLSIKNVGWTSFKNVENNNKVYSKKM